MKRTFTQIYLPSTYPEKTHKDFLKFSLYYFYLNSTNATLTFLSSQALFVALGSTTSQAALASAAFTWVIKDGIGILGGLAFAKRYAKIVDADIRKGRFYERLLLIVGLYIEILTLKVPYFFLPCAALANIIKNISIVLGVSTRIQQINSACKGVNIGEASGKFISQFTTANLLGISSGVILSKFFVNVAEMSELLPPFAVLTFFSVYFNYLAVTVIDEV